MYKTFEELVEAARAQGATHVTMGNWHEGAFWRYEAIDCFHLPKTSDTDPLWFAQLMVGVLGKPRYRHLLTSLAWFVDGDKHDYHEWELTEFIDSRGDPSDPDNSFIPIEEAVAWYRNWNKNYKD